jgi:SAM-dependent methyltransferase
MPPLLKSRFVPVPGESLPKQIAAKFMDCAGIFLNRGELLPPFSMRRTIGESKWQLRGEDFKIQGSHFAGKLTDDAGLRPNSKVLDLGSGCGRLALPMTKILSTAGEYVGLEPIQRLVRWCSKEITPRFGNFRFEHCDLCNSLYNKEGAIRPESFKFPFDNGYFDVVVATSVFTHLLPSAVANYAKECSRVLTRGGRLFASFFLLENGTIGVNAGLNFCSVLQPDIARVVDLDVPEKAVAYSSDWLSDVFREKGMRLVPPIHWGCWTGRQPAYSGQDVLILEKE